MAVACGPEAGAPGVARMAVACGPEAGAPGEQELFSETTLQGRASKHAVHSMISVCDQHHLCVSGTKT